MDNNIIKISNMYHKKNYEECYRLSKTASLSSNNSLIYLWFRALSILNLKSKEFVVELLNRAIRRYSTKKEFNIILAAVMLFSGSSTIKISKVKSIFQNLEMNDPNDPNDPLVYLIKLLYYKDLETNNQEELFNNMQLFLKYSTPYHFLIFDNEDTIGLLETGIAAASKIGNINSTIRLFNQVKNKILFFADTITKNEFNKRLSSFTEEGYVQDSQYYSKYESASYKYFLGLYSEALQDAEIALDKCENYDLSNSDIDLIFELIIAIKIELNDFDWLKTGYEDRILNVPNFMNFKWEYAQICIKNNLFSKAEKLLLDCVNQLKNSDENDFDKICYEDPSMFGLNDIIRFVLLDLIDSLLGQNKFKTVEYYLNEYTKLGEVQFDDDFYFKRVSRFLSNKYQKTLYCKN